ncbi:MAG: 50S ribosomal protein L28 [Elusimicrobia bacterium]|nr:50S ribosomal protein L28 [Elusimicrobiota bacterium]
MAYKCEICAKGPRAGKNVSHSKRATVRVFKPNLFRRRILQQGTPKRVYVCSTCIKTTPSLTF